MSYLLLDNKTRKRSIDNAIQNLKSFSKEFTHICVTGNSGVLILDRLCYALNKEPIIIRKKLESSHNKNLIDGDFWLNAQALFVDDFIDYGNTLSRVGIELNKIGVNLVGIYLYNQLGKPEYLMDSVEYLNHNVKFALSETHIYFNKIKNGGVKNVSVGGYGNRRNRTR